ncbi:MAG: hypothetical protein LBD20_07885 [Spirochaetaceae bacterium]|nr:hypothetical protein [Spirochaetaceae bacterium]
MIYDFIAEEKKSLFSKKPPVPEKFDDTLTESAVRLCEITGMLNKNLDASCKALGVVENAEQLFNDIEAVAKLQFSTAIIPGKCFGSL